MRTLLFIIAVISVMSSCSPKISFTQKIREEYKLQPAHLKGLQFYTSGDIVLQHAQRKATTDTIHSGELVIASGSSMDQVIIKAGTPGIVVKVIDKNKVAVSFETTDKYLVFGDAKDRKGPYTMLAAEWNNGRGKIEYGGKQYWATKGSSNVKLLFKMRRLNKFKKDERVAKGLKVD